MPDSSATKSPMQALIADSAALPNPPVPGEMVECVVVGIKNNKILIEIEGVYTGVISGREAIDGLDTAKNLLVGDSISAYVVEDENSEGFYVLSIRKVGREKAWEKLTQMQEGNEPVEVRIKEANKGGLMTELCGVRAFIPVSQLAPEHYPRVNGANAAEILNRLNKYIGEKFIVKIINVDREDDKLILSEKEALSIKRAAMLKNISVGQKIKGQVSGIVNFGIFIIFEGCLEGLVHVSEISWGRSVDPTSYARIGEDKEAVVIGIENDKISLSVKRLTPDPWVELAKGYRVGDTAIGKVSKITPFGAFVNLQDGLSGLIHISEIVQKEDAEKAEVNLEVGEEVTAKIINIELAEHRLGLSMKGLDEKDQKPVKKEAAKKTKKAEKDEPEEKAEKKESAKKPKEAKEPAKKAAKKTKKEE